MYLFCLNATSTINKTKALQKQSGFIGLPFYQPVCALICCSTNANSSRADDAVVDMTFLLFHLDLSRPNVVTGSADNSLHKMLTNKQQK